MSNFEDESNLFFGFDHDVEAEGISSAIGHHSQANAFNLTQPQITSDFDPFIDRQLPETDSDMNLQAMPEAFLAVGTAADSISSHFKASALATRVSLQTIHTGRRDMKATSASSDSVIRKTPSLDLFALPTIDSPKALRCNDSATNDSSSSSRIEPPSMSLVPSSYKMLDSHDQHHCRLAASPTSSSEMLSYEQETWRLYQRIQMARQDWTSALPSPLEDSSLTTNRPYEAAAGADDLGRSSCHTATCRYENDVVDHEIIFDLEL